MADPARPSRRPAIGLVVNPIAGLGGRVGLKGTDGTGTAARARALGAVPMAPIRAAEALVALRSAWPAAVELPRLITGDGVLGHLAAVGAGYPATTIGGPATDPTTAGDTRRLAATLAESVDLLLFAGGDGTARDVLAAVGASIAALGVPAGVKIQSAVFATSPAAAGRLAAEYLASGTRRSAEREVLDLDEEAYRRGEMAAGLHGYLHVPVGRLLQSRKAPSPASDAIAMAAIATDVVESLVADRHYVLGPGTTIRGVALALGLPKTLAGVDVVRVTARGPEVESADAGERQIREAASGGPVTILVTPIGGQGFLFGRGNQSISPDVIRLAGRDGIMILATPAKLAALGGRPLLVDTGDHGLDRELAGYHTVVTGHHERMVVGVEPA